MGRRWKRNTHAVSNDSDLSEENVKEENVDSFSKQEISDEEPVEASPHDFCVGKDKTTNWNKMRTVTSFKTIEDLNFGKFVAKPDESSVKSIYHQMLAHF